MKPSAWPHQEHHHGRRLRRLESTRATYLTIVAFLLNAALVGAGIYLSSDLKKKAEHLATREQFKDLQKETAELTRTTKEIEAKISDDVWNRQRRWELKRDLLLEMAKKMTAVYDAMALVYAVLPSTKSETKLEAVEKALSASIEFDSMVSQVALVCDPELTKALRDLGLNIRGTNHAIVGKELGYQNTMKDSAEMLAEYLKKRDAIYAMIRKELGIDPAG